MGITEHVIGWLRGGSDSEPTVPALVCLWDAEYGMSLKVIREDGSTVSAGLPADVAEAVKSRGECGDAVSSAAFLTRHSDSLMCAVEEALAGGRWDDANLPSRKALREGAPFGSITAGGLRYAGMGMWGYDVCEIRIPVSLVNKIGGQASA